MAAHRCEFRFYEELNDFLPPSHRKRTFVHDFDGTPSVKDRIESLGVPHTEVDLILVDGDPVGFDHRVSGGERVAVYPTFHGLDLGAVTPLRPPLREVRFVLDVHLGRLARYLRLLGFDSAYTNDRTDDELLALSRNENRILLTRDIGLLERAALVHGGFLHETDSRLQLREVLDRYHLQGRIVPLTRCARCNGLIGPTTPALARGSVPGGVLREQRRFSRCNDCGQVYWPGGHLERLRARLAEIGVWF
ncbi:twitching motility protein PilT [Prescottella agglutinans]|uniref:Twitching motility protein PilT n=1 Tax=Prescottella agglutinans TaxID=1644129 RepID=A0A3S3AFR8_9NOCA|nr:Mut7-C RNAse domain-containing protein [Prescottella agglutinans]RVW09068.1 twitching motility protein PilT [Prescottella agglutinans]